MKNKRDRTSEKGALPFMDAPGNAKLPHGKFVNELKAVAALLALIDMPRQSLRQTTDEKFKRGWSAVSFLYSGLHPDEALEHGESIVTTSVDQSALLTQLEPRLLAPFYERSGWPLVLCPIAKEAWRRYRRNALSDQEFYCSEAQMAGIHYRMSLRR